LNRGTWEILFSWQGHSSTYATWEKVTDFKLAYPTLQVGDTLFLGEGEMLWTLSLGKYTKGGARSGRSRKPTRVKIGLEIELEKDCIRVGLVSE
jgi:hypothetical protein